VAAFTEGVATCELHFDIATGPWTTERVFDGKRSIGIGGNDRSCFFGKARAIPQGTAIALAHNILDRSVRVLAIDHGGREHEATSSGQGSAGPLSGMYVEFDLPLEEIREFQLQSRQVGRFEIKNVALRPRKAGP
jgi:hypothetical protein